VRGEAGLGKSRLLAEASRLAADAGVRWLEGRALPSSRTISYSPFREIVAGDAEISEEESGRRSWVQLERRVQHLLGAEADDVLPSLGRLPALDVPEPLRERVRFLSGDVMGRQIFRASRRLLERAAAETPIVLALEDWHWADESSVDLLLHLLPLADR